MWALIVLLATVALVFTVEIYSYGVDFTVALIIGCGLVVFLVIAIILTICVRNHDKKHVRKNNDVYKIDEFAKSVSNDENLKERYQELLTITSCDSLEETQRTLKLPSLDQLRGTTFHKFYQRFYASKENLIALKLIECTWASECPLMHPQINRLLLQFDIMSKDHDIISDYPWLLPL